MKKLRLLVVLLLMTQSFVSCQKEEPMQDEPIVQQVHYSDGDWNGGDIDEDDDDDEEDTEQGG